jgi:hypothetical protein
MKKTIFIAGMMMLPCLLWAQRIDVPIKYATTEQEMYKLFEQMLDSVVQSDEYANPDNYCAVGASFEMNAKDTLMIFEQYCEHYYGREYICSRNYYYYLSNCMLVDFYERFLNYLAKLSKSNNYYVKKYAYEPLYTITNILIQQYESGKLSKNDSLKAWNLIELTIIRIINEEHSFYAIPGYHDFQKGREKYMTDNIRQALIREIKNPYYPTEYLDFYMSKQDTAFLDTTGIPANINPRWKVQFAPEELEIYEKEIPLYTKLQTFLMYERIGREEYNGLSAGQAYLKRKRDEFRKKGYLDINIIAEYAYKKQDELLIKHLKAFKKKHPDYPLEYF